MSKKFGTSQSPVLCATFLFIPHMTRVNFKKPKNLNYLGKMYTWC